LDNNFSEILVRKILGTCFFRWFLNAVDFDLKRILVANIESCGSKKSLHCLRAAAGCNVRMLHRIDFAAAEGRTNKVEIRHELSGLKEAACVSPFGV